MKIAAGLLSVLAHAPFVVGDLHEFTDWVAGCDNSRGCHATSFPEERYNEGEDQPVGDGNLSVSIKTSPAPGTTPEIRLAVVGEPDREAISRISGISIDGKILDLKVSGGDGLIILDAAGSELFVRHARKASNVALVDDAGQEIASASLRGWLAAAAYIDHKQYRTGTQASLAAPGEKAWDYRIAPPMPPRPIVFVDPPPQQAPVTLDDARLAPLRALDPCQPYAQEPPVDAPEYFRLDAAHTLLILPTTCGGYNPFRMPFVIDEGGNASAAEFWPYPGNRMENPPELPDLEWNQKEGRLLSFGRGRVLSDCGETSEFVWDAGKFRLVHFASIYPCRGSHDYITTYRLEVRAR